MPSGGQWSCTIKELKSGLHLGRMQVSQDAERVERSVVLPVCAYLLLVHLYGTEERQARTGACFSLNSALRRSSYRAKCIELSRNGGASGAKSNRRHEGTAITRQF